MLSFIFNRSRKQTVERLRKEIDAMKAHRVAA